MSRVRISESSAGLSAIVIAGVVLVLVFAKVVVIPLAFALTLSFLLVPAVSALERRAMRRTPAVALVMLVTCVCLGMGAYFLSRQVLSVAQTLPGYRANIEQKMKDLHTSSEGGLEAALGMIEDLAQGGAAQSDAVRVRVVGERSDQLEETVRRAGAVLEPVGEVGIVIVFTIYMLLNREDLRHRMLLLAGMGNINVITQAMEDASARISQYLVKQLQVNACYGLVFGTGLFFLGVPDAALWGVIAGALRIVPFAGALIGMLLPLLLSIAVSASWWGPALVFALFLVTELTTANVVEPWLFSSSTGISSLALLGSAIFWSMLWGWPGLVLATPLTVCVVVLGRNVPQLAFLHSLLGTNATLSPAARFYERLLAMDQTEAWAGAETYLTGKPLAKLYDTVILPVLSLAEEDRQKGVLNDVRWKFVLLSVGELVARLSEYRPVIPLEDEKSARSMLIEAGRAKMQKEVAVVCLYAGDTADQLATVMLTQLLGRGGYQNLMLGAEAVSDEILHGLAEEKDTLVLISALPPFAFARTRALCQRVRAHLPENRIAVGLWNSTEDADDVLARFGGARPEVVVSRLAQAVAQVEAWQKATRRV